MVNYGDKSATRRLTGNLWQSIVSETFFPLDTTFSERQTFQGDLDTWSLGIVGLSQMQCDGVLYKRHERYFLDEVESSLLIAIPLIGEVGFKPNARKTT